MVAAPAVLEYKVSGETTTHTVMGPAYFNSFLDTTGISSTKNATLTITLRIGMCKIGPGTDMDDMAKWPRGATNGRVKNLWDNSWTICTEWNDASYNQFCAQVKKEAESFWSCSDAAWGNKGITLINISKDWSGLDVPLGINATHQANVECDFHIEWAKSASDAHILIYAARLPEGASKICSWMTPGKTNRPGKGFLSTGSLTLEKSGYCGAYTTGGICSSNAVVAHEIGHALGLPHIGLMNVGSTCTREIQGGKIDRILRALNLKGYDGNIESCYAGESPADTANVMGKGSTISIQNTDPWRIRIAQHTHTPVGDWAVVPDRWGPIELARFKKL
ncbi:zinc metalloprotease [Schlesneria paludicola]|uniref:hypothetical protein n=1 Tax=Schlesneria paludicola TaxID=360056 RepID=UPI00029A5152|nr:hypothetical protein [Schlesneria paludicola]